MPSDSGPIWQANDEANLIGGIYQLRGDARVSIVGPVKESAGDYYVQHPPGQGMAFIVRGADLERPKAKSTKPEDQKVESGEAEKAEEGHV